MNDKELLEMAAKAAGIEPATSHGLYLVSAQWWNPLIDDGDAMRLAVDLSLDVECLNFSTQVNYDIRGTLYRCNVGKNEGSCNGDLYAATRRAIVCAAAEIGRNK